MYMAMARGTFALEERAITGGETALAEANARAPPWPKHDYPIQIDARRYPRATGPVAAAGGTAGGTRDHRSAERIRDRGVFRARGLDPLRCAAMVRTPSADWGR